MKPSYQILSVIIALSTLFLSAKQKPLKWPLGIIANIIALPVYYNAKLYIKTTLTIIFIINSLYGWINWRFGGKNFTKLEVTSLKKKEIVKYWLSFSLLVIFIGSLIKLFTNSYLTYFESISIFSVLAHWLLARKKIENWLIWIIIDASLIFVCISKGIYYFAFKYSLYIVLAFYSFSQWKKTMKTEN